MNSLLVTILIATCLFLAALFALSIGWFITGKHKIKPGSCGRAPSKKIDESCGDSGSCHLCKKENDEPR